jgi:hypothetical protein
MPTKRILKPIGALVAVTLLFALPAAAQANIAFIRGLATQTVYTAANNGKGVKKVGVGSDAHISPDGASVAYAHEGPGHGFELKVAPVGGGAGKTVMTNLQDSFQMTFSPNSEFLLAERGGELGKRKLVLITLASGAQKVLASGYFTGFSFDPESKEVVYAAANAEKFPPKSNVFRVSAAGGKPLALTHDGLSESPLWGPTGKIVFVRLLEGSTRKYGPKNELYLMNPDGKGVKRLTHTNVAPLLQGLVPTAWSANGKRILAQFGGEDTTYAVAVSATTGAQKPIVEATENGFYATALSPDGQTVYGSEGIFEPGNGQKIYTVPWSGGKPKVLIPNATLPSVSF